MKDIIQKGAMVCLVILFAAVSSKAFADYQWSIEEVDKVGPGSRSVEVKIDLNGTPHTAWAGCADEDCEETALWYGVRKNGRWIKTMIDDDSEDMGRHANIEIQSDGTLNILYGDHENWELRWARLRPGSSEWDVEKIGPAHGGSWVHTAQHDNKLFVTHTRYADDSMHDNRLEMGILQNGKWNFEVIERGGYTTSIAIQKDGQPVISSHDGPYFRGHTHVTWLRDGIWQRQPIDGNATKSDVAIDSQGNIHLVYCKSDPEDSSKDDIFYATNASGRWQKMLLDGDDSRNSDVFFPSIAIDQNDTLHVSYRDYEKNLLKYVRKEVGGKWEYSVIESMGRPLYSRLFVDHQNKLHVAIENLERLYYGVCQDCTSTK